MTATRVRRFIVTIAMIALASCNPSAPTGPAPTTKSTAGGVTTGYPTKKDLRRILEQPATIEAFEETPIVARIAGYVDRVRVDIGKPVHGPKYDAKDVMIQPGEVLAELSVPEMLHELKQKTALVKQAMAEVEQAVASHEAAEAAILTAKAQTRDAESSRGRAVASHDYWKGQFTRVADAVEKGLLEKQVREETLNKYKAAEAYREEIEAKVQSAQATTKESEANRNKSKADIDAARARVQVAEAEERRFAAMTEYRFLRAPFDGVVTKRNVNTGHFLQPGPSVLFVVARTDTLRIIAEIPETESALIVKDMPVKIQPPALKEQTFESTIARTSWTLDGKSRTLRVEIDYPNKGGNLRPGMYANLIFTIPFDGRWTLPASAIVPQGDQPYCWRVDANRKAVRTPVKLGVREGKDVEIVQMQLSGSTWAAPTGNEEIVMTNLGALSEGKVLERQK